MKKSMMLKMVRQEVRRTLKPTGLLGKRGPAKSVTVMVKREVEASPRPCSIMSHCLGLGLGGSQ